MIHWWKAFTVSEIALGRPVVPDDRATQQIVCSSKKLAGVAASIDLRSPANQLSSTTACRFPGIREIAASCRKAAIGKSSGTTSAGRDTETTGCPRRNSAAPMIKCRIGLLRRHTGQRTRRERKRANALFRAQYALRHHVVCHDTIGEHDRRLLRSGQCVVKRMINKSDNREGTAHRRPSCALQIQNIVVDAGAANVDRILDTRKHSLCPTRER